MKRCGGLPVGSLVENVKTGTVGCVYSNECHRDFIRVRYPGGRDGERFYIKTWARIHVRAHNED